MVLMCVCVCDCCLLGKGLLEIRKWGKGSSLSRRQLCRLVQKHWFQGDLHCSHAEVSGQILT